MSPVNTTQEIPIHLNAPMEKRPTSRLVGHHLILDTNKSELFINIIHQSGAMTARARSDNEVNKQLKKQVSFQSPRKAVSAKVNHLKKQGSHKRGRPRSMTEPSDLRVSMQRYVEAIHSIEAKKLDDKLSQKLQTAIRVGELASLVAETGDRALIYLLAGMYRQGVNERSEDYGIMSLNHLLLSYPFVASHETLFKTCHQVLTILDRLVEKSPKMKKDIILQQKRVLGFLLSWFEKGYYADVIISPGGAAVKKCLKEKIIPLAAHCAYSDSIKDYAKHLEAALEPFEKKEQEIAVAANPGEETRISLAKVLYMALDLGNKVETRKSYDAAVAQIAGDLRCLARDTFKKIPMEELLTPLNREKSPNWFVFCEQFNNISKFVEQVITQGVSLTLNPQKSAESSREPNDHFTALHYILFFTEVALKSLKLHDYHSSMAVFLGTQYRDVSDILNNRSKDQNHSLFKRIDDNLAELNKMFGPFNNMIRLRQCVTNLQEDSPWVFHIVPSFLISKDIETCKENSTFLTGTKRYNVSRLNFLARSMQQMALCKDACDLEEAKMAKMSTGLADFIKKCF